DTFYPAPSPQPYRAQPGTVSTHPRSYLSSHHISSRMPSQKLTLLVAVPWPLTLSHQAIGTTGLDHAIAGISRSRISIPRSISALSFAGSDSLAVAATIASNAGLE